MNENLGDPNETLQVLKLMNAKPQELIIDELERARFKEFLAIKARLYEEFAVVVPINEGKYAWCRYEVINIFRNTQESESVVTKKPTVVVCSEYPDQFIPEPFQNIPYWVTSRIDEDE